MILGDYHTHTTFSHGKGSIEDNVEAARRMGLKEIAVTDHGFRHVVYKTKRRKVALMRSIVDGLNERYDGIKVLLGIEANIYCKEGLLDLKEGDRELFDVVLAGFHKAVWPKNFRQAFGFFGRSTACRLFGVSRHDRAVYTRAYVRAVESGKIDILAHLNYAVPVDVGEVGRAARDCGVAVELNCKRINMTDDEIALLDDLGVKFVINSDAHRPDSVGDFALPLAAMERAGVCKDRIVNWGTLPQWR